MHLFYTLNYRKMHLLGVYKYRKTHQINNKNNGKRTFFIL
jgi:hypothetical protein